MWPPLADSVSDASFVSFYERRLVHHLNSHQLEDKPLCLSYNEYLLIRTIMWKAYFGSQYSNMTQTGLFSSLVPPVTPRAT